MVRDSMIVQRVLILSLTLSFEYVKGQDVIELEHEVHGKLMTTRKGNNISAYLGIPYAEPPIFSLRFANPIPWRRADKQPIIATTDAQQCPQLNNDGVAVGDEDCLYLNVYTPKTHVDGPYPVMVYFHGGNFVRGSGSSKDAGPEYLMDKEIVLVTVNYRLGALGFLSTGDQWAPGNFGLKDQALALQWVKTNIIKFGGQPDQVTIFGQDAGGSSTILHALSPGSQGLFKQYISQSGSPLSFWAFAQENDYKEYARYLGNYVKCPNTHKPFLLVRCLRYIDPYDLVASDSIFNGIGKWRYSTWMPTVEPALEGAFITERPIKVLGNEGLMTDRPAMIGNVFDEGLVLTAEFYANNTVYDSITGNIFGFIKPLIHRFIDDIHTDKTTKKVKDYYFKGVNITDKESITRNMTNFITDLGFDVAMMLQVENMVLSPKMPLYSYRFNYRGTYSKSSDVTGNNDNIGVCHGDDLIYLFPTQNSTLQLSDSDEKMIDIMVDFWTSFACNGAPTSQHMSDPNIWKRYKGGLEFLEIGKDSDPLDIRPQAHIERMIFWEDIIFGPIIRHALNLD